jgi:hypothetical protein
MSTTPKQLEITQNTLKFEIHLNNLFSNSVPTSQESHRVSVTKTNWLVLFRAVIVVSPGLIGQRGNGVGFLRVPRFLRGERGSVVG